MTIAIPTNNHNQQIALPDIHDRAAVQLIEWAQAADAAYLLAERLCSTQFAPAAYRGKPEEATAAIMAGAEVGLSPMAALRAFDNIPGTPAPKAITLRAIVQGQGHEVRIDESSQDRAVVSGRRKGDSDWQTSTWDMARANLMGLTGKAQWKQQPGAMLIARATAEVCRWIASDAIMGMPYTAEELDDQDRTAMAADRPAPRRITAADVYDAEPATPQPTPELAVDTRPMFAALKAANLVLKADLLDFIAETIGRRVESSDALTADEVDQITAAARALVPDGGDGP